MFDKPGCCSAGGKKTFKIYFGCKMNRTQKWTRCEGKVKNGD